MRATRWGIASIVSVALGVAGTPLMADPAGTAVRLSGLERAPELQRGPGRGAAPLPRGSGAGSYVVPGTGQKQEFAYFIPSKVDKKKKAPLVVALHGNGGHPSIMIRFLADQAQKAGYILVAPMGNGLSSWFGALGSAEEREFGERDVFTVINLIRREYTIDDERIYLVGHSMGGGGALHLGSKYAHLWAAVGAAAPAFVVQPVAFEKKTVPLIVVVGETDPLLPIDTARRWAEDMKPLTAPNEFHVLKGQGHGEAITVGGEQIFKFFAKYSRPASSAPPPELIAVPAAAQ